LLFIYSFIIYNLIYSFENLKKCGKNLEKNNIRMRDVPASRIVRSITLVAYNSLLRNV